MTVGNLDAETFCKENLACKAETTLLVSWQVKIEKINLFGRYFENSPTELKHQQCDSVSPGKSINLGLNLAEFISVIKSSPTSQIRKRFLLLGMEASI